MPVATAQAAQKLLTPNDHTLIMIDHQSQMAYPLTPPFNTGLKRWAQRVKKT